MFGDRWVWRTCNACCFFDRVTWKAFGQHAPIVYVRLSIPQSPLVSPCSIILWGGGLLFMFNSTPGQIQLFDRALDPLSKTGMLLRSRHDEHRSIVCVFLWVSIIVACRSEDRLAIGRGPPPAGYRG